MTDDLLDLDLSAMRGWFGLGVAGNVAGHLEQAGEDRHFAAAAAAAAAPKGIFPFYRPGDPGPLGCFPLSHDTLTMPMRDGTPLRLQCEPEVALACRVEWDGDRVTGLRPFALGACDDSSIRITGPRLLSEKKNWGVGSKGVAARFFAVDGEDDLAPDGRIADLRLTCTWRGSGDDHRAPTRDYGVDTPVTDYVYFGKVLLDWLVECIATQRGAPGSALEDVGALMVAAGRPDHLLVAAGATRYTALGETVTLRAGDRMTVAVTDTATGACSEVSRVVTAG